MPTISDLTPGTIFQGNDGDKWQVTDGMFSPDEITDVKLVKLKVEEVVIPPKNEELQELIKN